MFQTEIRKAAHRAAHLAHAAARAAQLPKACFLGITAAGSLLLVLLVSLSHR